MWATVVCVSTVVLSVTGLIHCTADFAGAVHLGCFIDSPKRLLENQQNFPQTLTPSICYKHCYDKGFAYAGTQYSDQCFCSNTKPPKSKKTAESDCNSKCAGDKSKMCGGNWRINVYSSRMEELEVADFAGAVNMGCYIEREGQRLLNGNQQTFLQTLTPTICYKYCFDKGFSYAGTQYSNECFCSNTKPPRASKTAESDCNSKCAGDESKMCGGNNRLNVYSSRIEEVEVEDFAGAVHMGCYIDSPQRLLENQQDFLQTLTPSICFKHCNDNGFGYAGTQYSHQCFCSNTKPPKASKTAGSDCNSKCAGDESKICGGTWRMNVYSSRIEEIEVEDFAQAVYMGCYIESEGQRLLNGNQQTFPQTLTPTGCYKYCYDKGFIYAGTQYSKECFCSNTKPPKIRRTAESDCNSKCAGDESKMCGGNNRLNVYSSRIEEVEDFAGAVHLGCYIDSPQRLLNGNQQNFPETLTPSICYKYCYDRGFLYAGTQYSNQCFCSNTEPPKDKKTAESDCNSKCAGDKSKVCGGTWRLNLYSKKTEVKDPLPENQCQLSETVVRGRKVCRNEVVFFDKFNTAMENKWKHNVIISDAPNYEFAVFQKDPKNCVISGNQLVIKPTTYDAHATSSGSFQLEGCTGTPGTRECGLDAFSSNILPPVASARIDTSQSFTFQYGIVEIRAKLPSGDWLVPELWLEPVNHVYGPHYASGRIRLGMSRGNKQLQCYGQDFGSNRLEYGIIMGPENNVRSRSVFTRVPDNWHEQFHNYKLIWKPDQISFQIDNKTQQDFVPEGLRLCDVVDFTRDECSTWSFGSKIAPFDAEFYISLGVSPGNARDFPDNCINRGKPKPWKNFEAKSMLKFSENKDEWSSTWSNDKSAMIIEYVRVAAL